MSRPEDCVICLNSYDEQECRPRNLPCGHTFCSACISSLLKGESLTCPTCCASHRGPNIKQFPIAYAIEDMIRVLKASQIGAGFQATGHTSQSSSFQARGSSREMAVGLSKKMQLMVEEQKEILKSLRVTLGQELDQLQQYQAHLAFYQSQHSHMIKELEKYVQLHQATIHFLQEEDGKVKAFVEEGKEAQRELENAERELIQVNSAQMAVNITVANDSSIARAEMWVQQSKEEIPNGTILNNSYKELEITKAALEGAIKDADSIPTQISSGHTNCTIMEAVKNTERRPIKFVDLSSKEVRKKMDAGLVFGIHKNENGDLYSSKITYNESKVYLHYLQKQPLPEGASTHMVSKTLISLDNFSVMFMDLSWNTTTTNYELQDSGTSTQRFHIRLQADTPPVKVFKALCLGYTGHTLFDQQTPMWFSVENNALWGTINHNKGKEEMDPTYQSLLSQMNAWQDASGSGAHITNNLSRGMLVFRTGQSVHHGLFNQHGACYPTMPKMQIGIIFGCDQNMQGVFDNFNPHYINLSGIGYNNSHKLYYLGNIEAAHLKGLKNILRTKHKGCRMDSCGLVFQV